MARSTPRSPSAPAAATTVGVRRARLSDGPQLYRAWEAVRQHQAAMDPRIVHAPVAEIDFLAALAEVVDQRTSVTFVADDGGHLAGFVRGAIERNQPARLPERHATISYLYVDPAYRRTGLGRRLFDALAGWAAAEDGVAHLEMPVLASDDTSTAFWQALGFTPFIHRLWGALPAPPLAAEAPPAAARTRAPRT